MTLDKLQQILWIVQSSQWHRADCAGRHWNCPLHKGWLIKLVFKCTQKAVHLHRFALCNHFQGLLSVKLKVHAHTKRPCDIAQCISTAPLQEQQLLG